MWLIHARTMRLVHIADEAKTPRYAILSHTWLPERSEVTFQDMTRRRGVRPLLPLVDGARRRKGWHKVANTCRLALGYGCEYAWIDTCCIDKTSSSELQEAINSMFRWYERAEVCFVHLADVSMDGDGDGDLETEGSEFRRSRWFRRGWTLQELLASPTLVFYDRDWRVISDKEDADTRRVITDITGIDDYYISRSSNVNESVESMIGVRRGGIRGGGGGVRGASRTAFGGSSQRLLSRASVAEKMSWMAGRETTRQEDMAYCLLGIFDINMPLLYGEGSSKAFQRLQEEIMRVDDDCSLLAWGWNYKDDSGGGGLTGAYEDESSLLAPHPRYFASCSSIRTCSLPGFNGPLFSMGQRGLRVRAPVRDDVTHAHLSYVVLGCGTSPLHFLAIPLVSNGACRSLRPGDEMHEGEFYRPSWCTPTMVSSAFLDGAELKEVQVRRAIKEPITIDRCPVRLLFQESRLFGAADVLAVYPPQPIPGALASLGRRQRAVQAAVAAAAAVKAVPLHEATDKEAVGFYEHFLRGSRKKVPRIQAPPPPRKLTERRQQQPPPPEQEEGEEDIQVMIHIRIPSSKELVLITVELSESTWHRSFRCRMFQCARQLGFEDLHALSVSQDYAGGGRQLQALGCRSDGGFFSFRVEGTEGKGVALEAMYTSMSDVDRVIIGIQGDVREAD